MEHLKKRIQDNNNELNNTIKENSDILKRIDQLNYEIEEVNQRKEQRKKDYVKSSRIFKICGCIMLFLPIISFIILSIISGDIIFSILTSVVSSAILTSLPTHMCFNTCSKLKKIFNFTNDYLNDLENEIVSSKELEKDLNNQQYMNNKNKIDALKIRQDRLKAFLESILTELSVDEKTRNTIIQGLIEEQEQVLINEEKRDETQIQKTLK